MMEALPAQAITQDEGYHRKPYAVLILDIQQAVKDIEEAYRRLPLSTPDDTGKTALAQALHQCSGLPAMLGQQLRMIEGLEQKFGEQFRSKCQEEVEEMVALSKIIRAAMQSAVLQWHELDQPAQSQMIDSIFKSTARLNLLQQRISGKMMKVKLA